MDEALLCFKDVGPRGRGRSESAICRLQFAGNGPEVDIDVGRVVEGEEPVRSQVRSPKSEVQSLRIEEQEVVEAEVTEANEPLLKGSWRYGLGHDPKLEGSFGHVPRLIGGHRPLLLADQFFDPLERLGDVLD
jgi:hypothetical protein